jgi:hypothetical protein
MESGGITRVQRMTGAWPTAARAGYRFGTATVEVASEDEVVGRWLAEFVTPWFSVGAPGDAGPLVRMISSAERFAALAARQSNSAVEEVACFGLDSELVSYPGWIDADGTTVVSDTKFGGFYRMHDQHIEVVARPGDRNTRIGLMRVVREIATLRVLRDPILDLHAAAFVWRGRAVLVAGNKNTGKTSLLAHALASGQAGLLANDRVMVRGASQAYGVPTVVSVREGTLRSFPAIAAGLPTRATLLTTEELASNGTCHVQTGQRMMLSPAQFARQLGAKVEASAPIGVVVFPEVSSDVESWSLLPITRADGARRLCESLYGRRSGPRASTWFQRLAGAPLAAEVQVALADHLAAKVPLVRCLLGPDAYRDSAEAWLGALPLPDGAAGT